MFCLFLFIVLPSTPHVRVITDNQHFKACFLSQDILTDFYEIALHDVTGELLSVTQHSNTTNCTIIDSKANLQECAPFMLIVSAINSFGVSSTNITVQSATNTSESNICSCFSENGELQVNYILL